MKAFARFLCVLCWATFCVACGGGGSRVAAPSANPSTLTFQVQPAAATLVGESIAPSVQVAILDAGGNVVTNATNAVTVAISTNPGGGGLSGTTIVNASNGVATFSDLAIDQPGTGYVLTASSPNLSTATSTAFNITVPLAFTVQPSGSELGSAITPAVEVSIVDAAGNVVPSATDTVSIGIAMSPNPGATLSGSTTVAAVNGVATFDSLLIDKSGEGFTLSASVGSTTVASEAFDVNFTIATISAGGSHTCAVQVTGDGYCWGRTSLMSFGTRPVIVSGGVAFIAITSGTEHACGISTNGDSYCWGPNHFGQLGDSNPGVNSNAPVLVQGGPSFVALAAGHDHTCGLTAAGDAFCWGFNGTGQLGAGATTELCPGTFTGTWPCSSNPVAVNGGLSFTALSAGGSNTCGITNDGDAYCWGHNGNGQLGTTTTETCATTGGLPCSTTPVAVDGGLRFLDIGTGREFSCAIEATGGVTYCWGANRFGELGDGNQGTQSRAPTPVQGGLALASVSGGEFHACGINSSGTAFCWGHNFNGQLGNGNTVHPIDIPVAVLGNHTFTMLSAGGDSQYHTCGVTDTGAAYCWGADFFGQLGNDFPEADSDSPVRVVDP